MLSRNPFSRPFPERPFGRSVIIGHARTAAFVVVALLFLFPPLLALAYGLITFAVALAYHLLTENLGVSRTGRRWTLLRWTLDQAVLLLLVSGACFLLYNYTRDWSLMNLTVLLYITVPTVLVGLIPIIVSGIALQLRAEGDNQRVAGRVQLSNLVPTGEAVPSGPLYGEVLPSGEVRVHYRGAESEVVAGDLPELLVRCHPRYLVNLSQVTSVSADAQGLRLRLRGAAEAVPVTKDYFRAI